MITVIMFVMTMRRICKELNIEEYCLKYMGIFRQLFSGLVMLIFLNIQVALISIDNIQGVLSKYSNDIGQNIEE